MQPSERHRWVTLIAGGACLIANQLEPHVGSSAKAAAAVSAEWPR